MHVRTHKDAFVTELYVKEGDKVTAGQSLVLLDSIDEDHQDERLEKIQKLRALAATEYEGDSVKVSRDILQFAIEVAADTTRRLQIVYDRNAIGLRLGTIQPSDVDISLLEYEGAKSQHERAKANLIKYNLTAQRFNDVNTVLQAYFASEKSRIANLRQRLKVIAPVSGLVELRVGVNSFLECGQTLVVIKAPHDQAT